MLMMCESLGVPQVSFVTSDGGSPSRRKLAHCSGLAGRSYFKLSQIIPERIRSKTLTILNYTHKKGYRNSTPGVLLLQIAPFFMFVRQKASPCIGVLICKTAPLFGKRGAVLQKRLETAPFFKKGYYFGTPRVQKKVKN